MWRHNAHLALGAALAACAPPADDPLVPAAPLRPVVAVETGARIVGSPERTCVVRRSDDVAGTSASSDATTTARAALVAASASHYRYSVEALPARMVLDASAEGTRVVSAFPRELAGAIAVAEGSCLTVEGSGTSVAGALGHEATAAVRWCEGNGLAHATFSDRYLDRGREVAASTVVIDCSTASPP